MTPRQPQLFATLISLHARLGKHGVFGVFQEDTLKYSDGPVVFELGDVTAIVADFADLGVKPDRIADALAAMALDHFGIEHEYGDHGLTLSRWSMQP